MKNELPEIQLEKHAAEHIQVMSFKELFKLLSQAEDHNPFQPHKIKFYLILMLTKKRYSHFLDFKSYELQEGSVLFVAANQVHHFNIELRESAGFALVFSSKFIDKHYFLNDSFRLNRLFNYHIDSPVLHQVEMENAGLVDSFAELHKEYTSNQDFAKMEMVASLLRVVLLKIERIKEIKGAPNVSTLWLETFNRFKSLLEIEYSHSRNSKTYASKLAVSYVFLNNSVKKLAGKTVKSFIDDYVVLEIKRHLISTSLTVNEVSFKTGFEEPSNMINFFKRKTGVTPLKFRQQL